MATATKHTWFAPKLRAAMERKHVSVRALSRLWRTDEHEETSRRSLNRYLNGGIVPRPAVRNELADALGVDRGELEPDDEEEDLFTTLLALFHHRVADQTRFMAEQRTLR